jgi:hypothetical protein
MRLSPREARGLAVGAIAISGILFSFRILPAWRQWDADARDSAVDMRDEVERARAGVRRLPAALDSIESRNERIVALAPLLVPGTSRSAAAASLASLVSGAASRAHVELGAVQIRPDSAGSGTFTRVAVRGDATGDLPGLLRMLTELEVGRELLHVREFSITQPSAGGPAEQPEALRLEFTVEGLARVHAAAKEGS